MLVCLITCRRFSLPDQLSCLLSLFIMYTTRMYSSPGGKPGRRIGIMGGPPLLESHHHHPLPPPHHPHLHQPQSYPAFYQSRLDTRYHYHTHPQVSHLSPSHYQTQANLHHSKKKTWNFIHEKMSYDTFFTMKRLIDRSHTVDEVLRWVTQNPGKISHNHYPIALQKIGQLLLLQQTGGQVAWGNGAGEGVSSPSTAGGSGESVIRQILENQDFQTLCDAIVSDCSKFDNFSIVNCLYAVAALGLPNDSQIVRVLEEECMTRLSQFNQKDISMVFSSCMKLHPSSQHSLIDSCLAGLEKNIERERHPQTLFLLLSYYRTKCRLIRAGEGPLAEQLLVNRKILRLVKHTLASVSSVRDHEMALLDEMLSACVREANNKSLELIFSSHLFYQNRQEKFITSLAEDLPKKVDSITPFTMALIAKYIARHRLRETRLLDTIAEYLVKKGEYLDSKVIQRLVFPFSRMSYRPANEAQFFSKLEVVLEIKALSSPLATVNIVMSFPYAVIVRRYLSLLDAAVELEYTDYTGPRLQDAHKVLMFDHALTADEVNRKYSYKGLVAEALRQLVDFLLWIDSTGCILPMRTGIPSASPCVVLNLKAPYDSPSVSTLTSDFQKFSPFAPSLEEEAEKQAGEEVAFLSAHAGSQRVGPNGTVPLEYNPYYTSSEYYSNLAKEHSLESQDSSTLSSPSDSLTQTGPIAPGSVATQDSLFQFSIGKILEDEGAAATGTNPESEFYEGAPYPEVAESDGVTASPRQLHNPEEPEADRTTGEQLPYLELEKLNGIEEVKQYLHKKLLEVPL
ncbi:hypothetical protein DNTS_035464 [Danionella cerebrum]|uniref:FAST kinase-like protein subdomain 2 domain-containing protein n=1 Tax=Danionella cerebrum TaxID=2873325 RepID=A0A553R624_9TELE|nr:hypothetical protein DNTS_035464 [Danionella translucida]